MSVQRCSGIILTPTREELPGPDKVVLNYRRLIDRLISLLSPLVDQVVLVAPDPEAFLVHDALITANCLLSYNTLTALHAGLFAARQPHALAVSWDRPFVQPQVLKALVDAIESQWDLIIPTTSAGPQPMPAIYSKNYLNRIENHLAKGQTTLEPLLRRVRLKSLSEKVLRQNDPELISFLSPGAPEDQPKIAGWLERHPEFA
jgi:molybdopterin-guanine dinucleotide biosynthesis protein A